MVAQPVFSSDQLQAMSCSRSAENLKMIIQIAPKICTRFKISTQDANASTLTHYLICRTFPHLKLFIWFYVCLWTQLCVCLRLPRNLLWGQHWRLPGPRLWEWRHLCGRGGQLHLSMSTKLHRYDSCKNLFNLWPWPVWLTLKDFKQVVLTLPQPFLFSESEQVKGQRPQ